METQLPPSPPANLDESDLDPQPAGAAENWFCGVVGLGVTCLSLWIGLSNGLWFLGLAPLPFQVDDLLTRAMLALILVPASLFLFVVGIKLCLAGQVMALLAVPHKK